jgi:hypothetical protein
MQKCDNRLLIKINLWSSVLFLIPLLIWLVSSGLCSEVTRGLTSEVCDGLSFVSFFTSWLTLFIFSFFISITILVYRLARYGCRIPPTVIILSLATVLFLLFLLLSFFGFDSRYNQSWDGTTVIIKPQ